MSQQSNFNFNEQAHSDQQENEPFKRNESVLATELSAHRTTRSQSSSSISISATSQKNEIKDINKFRNINLDNLYHDRNRTSSSKSSYSTNSIKSGNDDNKHENFKNSQPLRWGTYSNRSTGVPPIRTLTLLYHPLYRINPALYCGLFRGSVRQDWNTIENEDDEERNWEELKPHWFELFFDLMFVGAIVHISSEVASAYDSHSYSFIYTVFPQFGLLILCWLEQILYHSRFRMTQLIDSLFQFIYMASVLVMGLSIGNTQLLYKSFSLAYMFTKVFMAIMFIKSLLIPRAFNHSIYMISENVTSITICIFIEIFINYNEDYLIIYSVLFVYSYFHITVIVYTDCIRERGINIPINVPHIAERMGAFVLIILGETIISIMAQHIESTKEKILYAYTVTLSIFIIVYCIGKLYFGSQPTDYELHHKTRSHAMSASIWRARIYKWFHILLFFGLLGLGLGSKLIVHHLLNYHSDDPILVFMPGISCVLICICINIIRLTHPFNYSVKHPDLVKFIWILRIMCICIMFGILFTWNIINHFVILGVYVIAFIIQISTDIEAAHRLVITKAVTKKKSNIY